MIDSSVSQTSYSTDWVSDIEGAWMKAVHELRGKENLRYLEIGVFEGRSAIWFFRNVLTHPTSTMVGMDVFAHGTWDRCVANLTREGVLERSQLIVGRSQSILKKLPDAEFDIGYVDGDHRCRHVFQDISLSWDVLKVGGFMILDDYKLREQTFPLDCRPQAAIDSFLTCFFSEIDVYHFCNRQLIIKKKGGSALRFFCHSIW
jgi:predicted O-methyltransferase YrrM